MINLLAASAIMRSKVLMHRWLIISQSHDRTCNKQINHEIEIANNALLNFDRMIDLLVTRTIMRLNPKKHY